MLGTPVVRPQIIEELTADREWTRRDEVLAGARASAKRCEERAGSLVHLQRILKICRVSARGRPEDCSLMLQYDMSHAVFHVLYIRMLSYRASL